MAGVEIFLPFFSFFQFIIHACKSIAMSVTFTKESSGSEYDRRKFLGQVGKSALLLSVLADFHSTSTFAQSSKATLKKFTGDETVPVPRKQLNAPSEKQEGDYPSPLRPEKRIGYAIVGLGNLSLGQILPAFGNCKHAKPVALVSGDPEKAAKVATQYGIAEKNIYNYENFDSIAQNKEVDVVYVVLPNSMHHEYTIRAAKAGKHVLCEKPMANSVKECEEMIAACNSAGKKLMVAYRIQYEPHHKKAMEFTREKKYGFARVIESYNGQNIGDPKQWRLNKALSGGGAMVDIGIYCLNTCRYLLGEEPVSVLATTYSTPGDDRFKEVEETVMFQLQFPSGTQVNCTSSYGAHLSRRYRVLADKGGWFQMDPAFDYKGLKMEIAEAKGKEEWKYSPMIEEKNQFALEMDHLAKCIMDDKKPFTPGEEGLQDYRIIEAIYQSARENRKVELQKYSGMDVFRGTKPKEED
jgi:predicted dehydrogenase